MLFLDHYNLVKNDFLIQNLFLEIFCENKNINWPKGRGVYVIWQENTNSIANLLYIGKTGTFKRTKQGIVELNGGNFSQRANRWTPYKFSNNPGNYQFYFRYGPKEKHTKTQGEIQNQDNAYENSIPYSKLIIHFFLIDETHPSYTSTLLESLLLTYYLKETGNNLPPANNEL